VYQKKVLMGQQIDIPEAGGKFVIKDFDNAYQFRGRPIGEAFSGILIPDNGRPIEILLPVRFPDFDQGRKGNVAVSVKDYNRRYYTGLQVTKDPGVWVVYSGFILLIVGCYITFFMSHQRLCIDIVKKGKTSIVMVAGTANKNKLGVPNRIKNISEKLTKLA